MSKSLVKTTTIRSQGIIGADRTMMIIMKVIMKKFPEVKLELRGLLSKLRIY